MGNDDKHGGGVMVGNDDKNGGNMSDAGHTGDACVGFDVCE